MTEIRIRGRTFAVTAQNRGHGDLHYILTGPRGAIYRTMRNGKTKHRMYLIDARRFGIASTMRGVWLSDEHGVLTAVTQ